MDQFEEMIVYLLNALLIPIFERNDLIGSFSGILDLFPGFHLLLFQ